MVRSLRTWQRRVRDLRQPAGGVSRFLLRLDGIAKPRYIKNRVIAIFPNKEVEVGTMNPGDHLVVREVGGPDGRDWIAFIEAAGPPDAK